MKRERKQIDLKKLSLISAFLAMAVFIIGTTISMLVYPNYSFMEQFLSELGTRVSISFEGGELTKALYPEIFNVSLIITGVFLLPFFPS
ncbi:MAG: hypothetical protein ACXAAM_07310, partial [Candidatus Heimdallarchaeaceae archaeon]